MLERLAKILTLFIPVKKYRKKSRKNMLRFLQGLETKLKLLPRTIKCNKKFDLIVSLGADCQTSYQLRKNFLQIKSYPLDWLYSNETNLIAMLAKDNFKDFLNKDYLVITSHEANGDLHISNTKYQINLIHDFKGDKIENDYETNKEKYTRRINRLLRDIQNSNKILLVYLSRNANNEEIKNLHSTFKEKYPTKNFYLYWIYPSKQDEIIQEEIDSKIFKIYLNNIDLEKDENDRWKGNDKNYYELYKDISLTIKGIINC